MRDAGRQFGRALSPEDAQKYADHKGLTYVDVDDIAGDTTPRTA